jgi:hypothetical protein
MVSAAAGHTMPENELIDPLPRPPAGFRRSPDPMPNHADERERTACGVEGTKAGGLRRQEREDDERPDRAFFASRCALLCVISAVT